MTHHLKIWSEYYNKLITGEKTWELRKNDRSYRIGDVLCLEEFDTDKGYSGRSMQFDVVFILHGGQFGLQEGYCIMTIKQK